MSTRRQGKRYFQVYCRVCLGKVLVARHGDGGIPPSLRRFLCKKCLQDVKGKWKGR